MLFRLTQAQLFCGTKGLHPSKWNSRVLLLRAGRWETVYYLLGGGLGADDLHWEASMFIK